MSRPVLPCWLVDVRHERMSGRLGHFRSRPLRLGAAQRLVARYEATGTPAAIQCIEELARLHRQMIRGEIEYAEALAIARRLGWEIEP